MRDTLHLKCSIVDIVIYGILLIIIGCFLCDLDYKDSEPLVLLSFGFISLICIGNIISASDNISIQRFVYLFVFVFFFMAPIQQYSSNVVLWKSNGLSYSYSHTDYLRVNLLIIVALIAFDFGIHSKNIRFVIGRKRNCIAKDKNSSLPKSTQYVMAVFSTAAFLVLVITDNIIHATWSGNLLLQLLRILQFWPVCSFLFCMMYRKQGGAQYGNIMLLIILCEVCVIFFPLWGSMPRFLILGTYVVIYAYFFKDSKNKSILVAIVVLGFSLSFSNLRYITNLSDLLNGSAFNFNHVDFDAYQMMMAAIKYTKKQGYMYGLNIISAIAFLVPRSIWSSKLESSGGIVIAQAGSGFTNVSMPLFGEFYLAFGIIGVLLLCYFLGKIVRKIDNMKSSKNCLKQGIYCTITGMSIYIMRGSMLPTFAFTGGLVLSLLSMYTVLWVTRNLE